MLRACLLLAVLGACDAGAGALELSLRLPADPALRPSGMTTVTVTALAPGESAISTTSALDDASFTAGELPVGRDVQVGVVLRDVQNRIVGVGDAGQLVDIRGDRATEVAIPVRRPFVYAASGSALYSFDPTLDPRAERFQGELPGATGAQLAVSVGGDRLAVITSSQVLVVQTATNQVTGMIAIPPGSRDAAAVPGTNQLAIAGAAGISVVDLETRQVVTAAVGAVDRVTVGPAPDGALYAFGLVGRVEPPLSPPPFDGCGGTSSVVTVSIAEPATVAPRALPVALSDIAAAPDEPGVFVTLPCAGQVARLDGDLVSEIAALTVADLAPLPRAALLTVAGDRIWAAGTRPSTPRCDVGGLDPGACSASSQAACPGGMMTDVLFVSEGATTVVMSMARDGTDATVLTPPGRRETIVDTDDPGGQHAQVLKALGVVPRDLVVLPGGQYVALVTTSRYYIAQLGNQFETFLPCLDATTADWQLFDLASSSIASRVRTSCDVTVGPATLFPDWACEAAPPGEQVTFPMYEPLSVGALFGAR